MIRTLILLKLIGVLLLMNSPVNGEEEKGIIGRSYEDGLPVIYKFINEMPPVETRNNLKWLTVISWKYDGSNNNGMPIEKENKKMITLERTIEDYIENDKVLLHAYSKTGNNLKELVYYIHDQDQFLEKFNKAMTGQPRYPIEITFYKDDKWEEFQNLLNDFSKAANK
jgi:hypothetical protein